MEQEKVMKIGVVVYGTRARKKHVKKNTKFRDGWISRATRARDLNTYLARAKV